MAYMKHNSRRHSRISALCLLLFFIICLLTPLYLFAEVVDKVVAVVNDEVITLSELEEETAGLYRSIAQDNSAESTLDALEEAREATLNSMIERRLIKQKAKKYNITVTDEDVNNAYEGMRKKMSLNPLEFQQKLAESGLTEESYRYKLKSQILQQKLLSFDVRDKIVVTDEMVLDYFDENYTSKVDKGSYYLLQMGFSWPKTNDPEQLAATKKETREKAERVYNLAKGGQDFKSLAKKFSDLPSASDGGDIGSFTLDEMAPAMRDAVAPLKPNELSKIIETPAGYQFFKLLSGDKNAIVVSASFEAVKEDIKQKIFEEKLKEAYSEWVKKLKDDAYIQRL
jgi:peptidyl-prolyl cis-trans isomerase SurA